MVLSNYEMAFIHNQGFTMILMIKMELHHDYQIVPRPIFLIIFDSSFTNMHCCVPIYSNKFNNCYYFRDDCKYEQQMYIACVLLWSSLTRYNVTVIPVIMLYIIMRLCFFFCCLALLFILQSLLILYVITSWIAATIPALFD